MSAHISCHLLFVFFSTDMVAQRLPALLLSSNSIVCKGAYCSLRPVMVISESGWA